MRLCFTDSIASPDDFKDTGGWQKIHSNLTELAITDRAELRDFGGVGGCLFGTLTLAKTRSFFFFFAPQPP